MTEPELSELSELSALSELSEVPALDPVRVDQIRRRAHRVLAQPLPRAVAGIELALVAASSIAWLGWAVAAVLVPAG